MRRVRLTRRLQHLLCVAVIGGDERDPTGSAHRVDNVSKLPIDFLDRTDDGRDVTRVPDHVRVRKVDDHEARHAISNACDRGRGHAGSTHLGLKVVRCNIAGRGNHAARFPRVCELASAIEEVRHVGILLGLGDVELRDAGRFERVRQDVIGPVLWERDRAGLTIPVRGHRRQSRRTVLTTIEGVEPIIGESHADLPRSIRTKVEKDDLIVMLDAARTIADHRRLDEFIRDASVIRSSDRSLDRRTVRSGTLCV